MRITIKRIDQKIPDDVFPPLWKRLAFPLIGLGLMIGILCYILYFSAEKEDPQTIPLIQAEPGPYRIRPENPGGRSVAHQDKLVYERLSLQHPPEYEVQFTAPVEDPIDIQKLDEEKGISELAQKSSAPSVTENESVPVLVPVKPMVSAPAIKPIETKKVPQSTVVTAPVVSKKSLAVAPLIGKNDKKVSVAAKTSPLKLYRIQLASCRSADILVKEWKRLQQLYPEIFKEYKPTYLRLKEDNQIYYALRVGNFSTLAMVKKLHQKLQQKKINCKIIETPSS